VQFVNYADFRNKLQNVIDSDDASQSSLSTELLDLMVASGEMRLYRDVTSSSQDTTLAATVTSNLAGIPADCIQFKSVIVGTGRPLKYIPYEDIEGRIQSSQAMSVVNTSVTAVYYSQQDNSLVFWPLLTDGTVVGGRYIKKFPDISSSTGITGNTFFSKWPDLWLYAALAESAPYIGDDDRIPLWEAKYQRVAADIKLQEMRQASAGSKLQVRIVK
jgi:hypothetical protein